MNDPRHRYDEPPQPPQKQPMPGHTDRMRPTPDHGEETYSGSGKLKDRVAVITGGDSGIGRAVAIAFAREGADVLFSYYDEHDDAAETTRWIEEAGKRSIAVAGDIKDQTHCQALIDRTMDEFGRVDCLVNNAAHQASFERIEDISAEEWDVTFRTNVHAMFYLCQAAIPRMKPGSTIINTTSINAKDPSPRLLAYATTKGAIFNFTGGLAGYVADRGIRVNGVAPGPVWTPLIPSTMPEERVESFGTSTPLGRAGQPAELAAAYVYLASDDSSYVTGAIVPVTGGRLML